MQLITIKGSYQDKSIYQVLRKQDDVEFVHVAYFKTEAEAETFVLQQYDLTPHVHAKRADQFEWEECTCRYI